MLYFNGTYKLYEWNLNLENCQHNKSKLSLEFLRKYIFDGNKAYFLLIENKASGKNN